MSSVFYSLTVFITAITMLLHVFLNDLRLNDAN